ncbi:restriction endonuclease subunit S [Salegentibacter chungangensis]|uniref:Restriction endonuclease subunit S n=1 Tax=Salegentibacter chungangensis TaxID=1335724 RepID=A0ABW3NTP8_9FLAO
MELKETKIGFCIPDFDPIRLKDFLSSNDAGKWGADPKDDNSIAVVRSTNFNDTGYLDLSDVAERALSEDEYLKTKLKENDIVIERSGGSANQPVGRVSFVTKDIEETGFGFSNFIQRIRVSDEYDAKFVFYCLYHLHSAGITQTMQTQTNGIRNLEYRYYLNQRLPKPSPTEQTQIANALSTVDKTIQATKNSIAKLEKLKTSLMQNLLTGKMKPDGSWRTEDEFYLDEKFGKVPKGWRISYLKEVQIINKASLPASTDPNYELQYITIEAVSTDSIDYDLVPTYKFSEAPGRARRIIKKGDFIVSTVRPNLKGFARIKEEGDNLICSTGFATVSPKGNQVSDFYFFQILSFIGEKQFASFISGSNYPAVTDRDFKKLKVYEAPFEEQKIITEKIQTVFTVVENKQESIKQLNNLKKSLMQNLLTGKVRIPEDAKNELE